MVMASIIDYFYAWWQLPIFLAGAGAWLVGGPVLLRRALARVPDLRRSQRSLGRCARISLLANGVGLAGALVVAGFFLILHKVRPSHLWLVPIVGVGLPTIYLLAWATAAVMLNLPASAVRKAVSATTGLLIIASVALGCGAFLPAFLRQRRERDIGTSSARILSIARGLDLYEKTSGREARDLEALVAASFLKPAELECPLRPDRKVGYLYVPKGFTSRKDLDRRILVCDRPGNIRGMWVVVLAAQHDMAIRLREGDFQALLRLPVNATMAQLVEKDGP